MPIIIRHEDYGLLGELAGNVAQNRALEQGFQGVNSLIGGVRESIQRDTQVDQAIYGMERQAQNDQQNYALRNRQIDATNQRTADQLDWQREREAMRAENAKLMEELRQQNRLGTIQYKADTTDAHTLRAMDDAQQQANDGTATPFAPPEVVGMYRGRPVFTGQAPSSTSPGRGTPASSSPSSRDNRPAGPSSAELRASAAGVRDVDPYAARQFDYSAAQATQPGYLPPTVAAPTAQAISVASPADRQKQFSNFMALGNAFRASAASLEDAGKLTEAAEARRQAAEYLARAKALATTQGDEGTDPATGTTTAGAVRVPAVIDTGNGEVRGFIVDPFPAPDGTIGVEINGAVLRVPQYAIVDAGESAAPRASAPAASPAGTQTLQRDPFAVPQLASLTASPPPIQTTADPALLNEVGSATNQVRQQFEIREKVVDGRVVRFQRGPSGWIPLE